MFTSETIAIMRTSRLPIFCCIHGFPFQIDVVSHSDRLHVLELFTLWSVWSLDLGWIVVAEQGGAQSRDGQAADQDDDDNGGGGESGHVEGCVRVSQTSVVDGENGCELGLVHGRGSQIRSGVGK